MAFDLFLIGLMILVSAFFSVSEISLAASRKLKLRQLDQAGAANAQRVVQLQDNPGNFFTVVQIGGNAVAILAGIIAEPALTPYLHEALREVMQPGPAHDTLATSLSFVLVTSLFILFADLLPRRIGMVWPESVAMAVVKPMHACMWLFAPLVFIFSGLTNLIFRLLRLPPNRQDSITADDIMALADAGAQSGELAEQEQKLITNVFELDVRIVPSAMTIRDNIVYFTLAESEESIRAKIARHPHGKFPVCRDAIDSVVGYVDSKDILPRILEGKPLSLRSEPIVRNVLMLPDTLSLIEALQHFRDSRENFALIINEYALVVGLLTLGDVMSTVMGELTSPFEEELIVRRDDHSWLIDGATPIEDVMEALAISEFEGFENYETVAGFLMYTLRKVPRRTDTVEYAGFKFEVVDIDQHRIDQVLVTRADATPAG